LSWVTNYQVLTLYAFCRLALGDGVSDVSSYSLKSNVTSSSVESQRSQVQMGEELQQTKVLVQQLLQSNHAMQYTMMQVIILTSVVC
jgi:hypothetical protein